MYRVSCKRCHSDFYTASPTWVKSCPYCGYVFDSTYGLRRRSEERADIHKTCVISKGDLRVDVVALDISPKGVGVGAEGPIPFQAEDTLRVVIKDFEVDSIARVV